MTDSYLTNMGYNSAQQPTGFNYGNGVVASFGYNDHLQLSTLKYSLNASDLLNLTYSYQDAQGQNNGQIQGITDTRGAAFSTTYAYDGLGRLQQAQTNDLTAAGTWRLAWTYDRYGNRLTQTLTGGTISVGQPQLTVDPATNHISGFGYDANGNLIHDGPSNSNTYTFDAENRMTQSVVGSTTANYSYDGNNLRVVKGSTVYIYSGAKVIAEYASGAQPTSPSKEYIYSGSKLLATLTGSTVTYHHPDHLSNRVETSSTGAVTRSFGQLPFGETWYENTGTDKWKFTNYERDNETGFDYAINRYYNNGYGRFMSTDLLGGHLFNPQSLNRYGYVINDPVNLVDPRGLDLNAPWQCTGNVCTIGSTSSSVDVWGSGGRASLGGGAAGGGPSDPSLPLIKEGGSGGGGSPAQKPKDDCHKFADMVEQIANEILGTRPDDPGADVQNFMNKLAQTFTEFPSASVGALHGDDGRNGGYSQFGSSGFADPYYEADEVKADGTHVPSNQVRHAVGGLLMGYVVGTDPGLYLMDRRENPNDPVHGVPDLNLNQQTVPEGNSIAVNASDGSGTPYGAQAVKGLANWIRNTLCKH